MISNTIGRHPIAMTIASQLKVEHRPLENGLFEVVDPIEFERSCKQIVNDEKLAKKLGMKP